MLLKILIVTLMLCEMVIQNKSACNGYESRIPEHKRIKRSKYYSNPPQRFYRKPPTSYPIKGPFSYTPPPSYMIDDEEPQFLANPRPFKVSKRPTNEGLGDEDLNNLMKYLSKQDLDKIVEFAAEKEGKVDKYRGPTFEKYPDELNTPHHVKSVNKNSLKFNVQEIDSDQGFPTNDVNVGNNQYSIEYSNSPQEPQDSNKPKIIYVNNLRNIPSSSQLFTNIPLDTQESVQNSQISYLQTYIHNGANAMVTSTQSPYIEGVLFTDGKTMKEEELPKPSNLREHQDYEISYTNNVPTVVKPNSSYKVENFGDLPLMNFDSKLDTVSSYYVPHYSVTSSVKSSASSTSSLGSSSSLSSSAIQAPYPASSASVAQQQSDAHLKAIKIWTHRSKGTAYTLHNDGTLSLERPLRPKTKYGYP